MPQEKKKVCSSCRNAKKTYMGSCYCRLYGITIGYYKTECRGYEDDAYEIWKRQDYD